MEAATERCLTLWKAVWWVFSTFSQDIWQFLVFSHSGLSCYVLYFKLHLLIHTYETPIQTFQPDDWWKSSHFSNTDVLAAAQTSVMTSKLCKCESWGMFTAPFCHGGCREGVTWTIVNLERWAKNLSSRVFCVSACSDCFPSAKPTGKKF